MTQRSQQEQHLIHRRATKVSQYEAQQTLRTQTYVDMHTDGFVVLVVIAGTLDPQISVLGVKDPDRYGFIKLNRMIGTATRIHSTRFIYHHVLRA